MVTVAAAKAAAGGQRAGEVCRAMAVPLVDRQFKIPQNHPSKRTGGASGVQRVTHNARPNRH